MSQLISGIPLILIFGIIAFNVWHKIRNKRADVGVGVENQSSNLHIKISLILFALCLLLPGYYLSERHDAQLSLVLLGWGWLGPLDGHFSWYANLFYFLAVGKYKNKDTSTVLGMVGLLLAISFMAYHKIMVSEAPTYASITAYGMGYFLWVTSIGSFAIGQFLLVRHKNIQIIRVALSGWIVLTASIYSVYYYVGDNSLFSIQSRRNAIFKEICNVAEEHVFRRPTDTRGIFFDPDATGYFSRTKYGFWYNSGGGVIGLGLLNSGQILFYETNSYWVKQGEAIPDGVKYTKYVLNDHRGVQSGSLESEYAVITEPLEIPHVLNIGGAKITIKDLRNDSVVATTTYVFDRAEGRFCGHQPQGFSTTQFVVDVLGLTRNNSFPMK
jgi:hypothetical protein